MEEETDEQAQGDGKVKWSVEAEDKLVDNLEKHPCLYNTRHEDFKDGDKRAKAKQALAELTGHIGK